MDKNKNLDLLLVDDEPDFRRATSTALIRRGFTVSEAASGEEALERIARKRPDFVVLDLKMPGMGGIETLRRLRETDASLPVIILTGHGDVGSAMAGIRLSVADFLQKPVDIDQLAARIRALLRHGEDRPLRERSIREMMVSPAHYPRLYDDQPVTDALSVLRKAFYRPAREGDLSGQVRSALVYDRQENFLGLVRFIDLLKLVLMPFLEDSPYTTYFTGMFLARCKVLGKRSLRELLTENITIEADAPLMQAVHLMVRHSLINLPVMEEGRLAGILRERDVVLEIACNAESL
ncbi:MAG: response regulator [Acidobacteria bacterium]|nr:response regulator [Acidobacteriota bacterium]